MTAEDSHGRPYFSAGGALDPVAPSYVARPCDREALEFVLQRRYVSILGPRQVGKTSLLNKLDEILGRASIPSTVIDLSGFPDAGTAGGEVGRSERAALAAAWYSELAGEVADKFSSSLDPSGSVQDLRTFSKFLNQLEVVAQKDPGAVIMLDEAASVPDSLKTEFFMKLRTLLNTRSNHKAEAATGFTFVFAGAFYPSALVTNQNVSPFNVSETIYVPDFTRDEVNRLVRGFETRGIILEPTAAEEIWNMTRGHPFLTQKLCASVDSIARTRAAHRIHDYESHGSAANGEDALPLGRIAQQDVQDAARTIGDQDPHLHYLVRRLDESPAEVELIRRVVMDGENVRFSRLINPAAAQLEMIGALTEEDGYARVRNPIYGKLLREYLSARGT